MRRVWASAGSPLPLIRTCPASGFKIPISMAIVVVLPAPLGASRPNVSPACTSRSRSSTATMAPNDFLRPTVLIIGRLQWWLGERTGWRGINGSSGGRVRRPLRGIRQTGRGIGRASRGILGVGRADLRQAGCRAAVGRQWLITRNVMATYALPCAAPYGEASSTSSPWSAILRMSSVIFIEQYFGPHMLQK